MSTTPTVDEMEQTDDLGLPHEVIMEEILIKLPIKNLCRFKAFSKLWNATLSSYKFAKADLNDHEQLNSNSNWVFIQVDEDNSRLLNCEASDRNDKPPVAMSVPDHDDDDDDDEDEAVELISLGNALDFSYTPCAFGSSCGLVSLLVHDLIYVCNPILRQLMPILRPYPFRSGGILLLGLGHVSSKDNFEVVFALSQHSPDLPMIYVHSYQDFKWRVVQGSDQFHILRSSHAFYKHEVLVNERLHWLMRPSDSKAEDDGCIFIFDLLHEVAEEIPIPKELMNKSCHLITIKGCLGAIVVKEKLEIWIQNSYGRTNSWVRLCYDDVQVTHINEHYGVILLSEARMLHLTSRDGYYNYTFFADRIQPSAFEGVWQ